MGIVVYHWWEYKLSHYGKQWFLKKKKKKKIELSYDPGIPLLSVYPKDMKPAS